jgi:sulfur-oxidizing protein SoxX
MNMKSQYGRLAIGLIISLVVYSASAQRVDPEVQKILGQSFQAKGIAGLDRLVQDENQALCSDEKLRSTKAGLAKQAQLQKVALAAIKPPSDGVYVGDWKSGERIAQSGRGSTWSDAANATNGGSCYNCHQIDKKEISHGNIGPSLIAYGKTRGYSDEITKYTWNRINNSKAYNACSNMPRFGHFQLLTEQQIKDVLALLLDPQSPVNQ